MELSCCLCMYAGEGSAASAVTVISGYAVCEECAGYIQNFEFLRMVGFVKEGQVKR